MQKETMVAIKAAKEAGKIIMKFHKTGFSVKKKGRIDLVTEADVAAEKKILSIIKKSFPKDDFLAEESAKDYSGSERVWIIDPIDGTTNFSHGFPWFATSIALKQKEEMVGVIFDHLRKELYTAEKGKGAYLNGERIFVSKKKLLVDSIVATGFPYDRGIKARKTVKSIGNLTMECQGVRRLGSAVLDFAFVARGALDGFFEYKLFPWDVAAGILLVKEAGGKVTSINGEKVNSFSEHFLSSNGLIHEQLKEKLVRV